MADGKNDTCPQAGGAIIKVRSRVQLFPGADEGQEVEQKIGGSIQWLH